MSASQGASARWPKWLIGVSIIVAVPLALEVLFGFTAHDLYVTAGIAFWVVIAGALYLAARKFRGVGMILLALAHFIFLGFAAIVVPDFLAMLRGGTWAGLGFMPVALVLGFPWSLGWVFLEFSSPWIGWLGLIVNYVLLCRLTFAKLRAQPSLDRETARSTDNPRPDMEG